VEQGVREEPSGCYSGAVGTAVAPWQMRQKEEAHVKADPARASMADHGKCV
jgi:hypothetical protein